MAGFKNVREWADAINNGQTWSVTLQKGSIGTTPSDNTKWVDWSYLGGSPSANYYASSPLVAAVIDSGVRPYLPSVSPAKQFLYKTTSIIHDANSSVVYGIGQRTLLMDYLLYYPLIDFTAVDELQEMTNSVTLPRYIDGAGVQMLLIGQSAFSGGGTMTVTYTNQDGVQKTTPVIYLHTTTFGGVVPTSGVVGSNSPFAFLPLAAGDSGVRDVISVYTTASGGGIGAIVLVKPLVSDFLGDPSTRMSTGGVVTGSFAQTQYLIDRQPIRIYDGAHLGVISNSATSNRDCRLISMIETVWN